MAMSCQSMGGPERNEGSDSSSQTRGRSNNINTIYRGTWACRHFSLDVPSHNHENGYELSPVKNRCEKKKKDKTPTAPTEKEERKPVVHPWTPAVISPVNTRTKTK